MKTLRCHLPILCALLLALALFSCKREPRSRPESEPSPRVESAAEDAVTCPVCDLEFSRSQAVGSVDHRGQTYYFFLKDHQEAFRAAPEAYISVDPPESSARAADSQ